jgi:hypothetical protein
MSVMRCCAAFPEWACDGHAGRGSNQSSGIGRIGRCLSCLRRYRRADRWPDPFVADRRGWPLGAGQGRADLVPRNRADIGRLDDDAFLSLAVSALFRHRASARGAPAWANGCRRRGSDVAAARLFRPAARHRVDRRQGTDRCEAGRVPDSVTTLRLPAAEAGRRVVAVPGTDRGAGLAGVGEPNCGRGADLLAVSGPVAPLSRPDRIHRYVRGAVTSAGKWRTRI